jgi:hypothetical protein
MRIFIWVIVVILALETVGKLTWLAQQKFPVRTPGVIAADCVVGVVLLCWAIWVLS